jgi:hypothetical protein
MICPLSKSHNGGVKNCNGAKCAAYKIETYCKDGNDCTENGCMENDCSKCKKKYAIKTWCCGALPQEVWHDVEQEDKTNE